MKLVPILLEFGIQFESISYITFLFNQHIILLPAIPLCHSCFLIIEDNYSKGCSTSSRELSLAKFFDNLRQVIDTCFLCVVFQKSFRKYIWLKYTPDYCKLFRNSKCWPYLNHNFNFRSHTLVQHDLIKTFSKYFCYWLISFDDKNIVKQWELP